MSSANYEVLVDGPAQKALEKLPKATRLRLLKAIEKLSSNPRPSGVKKMEDEEDLYRIRVGDFRIIYTVEDDKLLVLVVRIGARKDVYRQR